MNSATSERPPGDWLTAPRFAALLGLLVVVAYPDVVFGLRSFASGDFGRFGHPIAHFHREALWRGEVPVWNPLNDFGLPFLAQWNTLTLYPGALLYLLTPMSWGLGVFGLLHLWGGGVGMFLLARRWTGHALAAAFAGVAYAFSAVALHSLLWPNNSAALGWLPWVVLGWERAQALGDAPSWSARARVPCNCSRGHQKSSSKPGCWRASRAPSIPPARPCGTAAWPTWQR